MIEKAKEQIKPLCRRFAVLGSVARGLLALALLLGALLLPANTNVALAQATGPTGHTAMHGYAYSCAVTSSGGVQCWGQGGLLGDGTNNPSTIPVNVVGLTGSVRALSASYYQTCALLNSGGVMCWGVVGSGALGYSPTGSQHLSAHAVTGLTSGVIEVSSGIQHACALTSSGGAKCWGYNSAIGDGSTTGSITPVDVTGLTSGVIDIAAGGYHTCALTSSGGVKCWGTGSTGQLGNGATLNSTTPVNVTGLTSGVIQIAAGRTHTCALLSSGSVKCWGDNNSGGLGDGTTTLRNTPVDVVGLSGVAALTLGQNISCALLKSGTLTCWGDSTTGAMGYGGNQDQRTPHAVPGLSDVVDVGAGSGGSGFCATTRSGSVYCWGYDGNNVNADANGTGIALDTMYSPAGVVGLGSGGGLVPTPLSINKSAPTPYPPVAGQPVTYSIVVTNTGTSNLTNVTVTDMPGPGLGSMTGFTSNPAGTCNTTTHVCTLTSALAAGAAATFNLTFTTPATAGVVITNTAYVNADQWQIYVYPTKDPIAALTVAGTAVTDLVVTKTASVTSATPGTPYDYTITVTNNSSTTATNVKAVDTLPVGVTFTGAMAQNGGSCSNVSGVVTCTWATLAGNASTTATITVTP